MDNFFTSIPLFADLLNSSTYACGTVRINRKYFPEDFKIAKDLNPGESEFWQSGNFVATIWQDKRAVRFLSTCCKPEGKDVVERKRKNQETLSLSCVRIGWFVLILSPVLARNGGFASSIILSTWQWQIVLFFTITHPNTMNSVN